MPCSVTCSNDPIPSITLLANATYTSAPFAFCRPSPFMVCTSFNGFALLRIVMYPPTMPHAQDTLSFVHFLGNNTKMREHLSRISLQKAKHCSSFSDMNFEFSHDIHFLSHMLHRSTNIPDFIPGLEDHFHFYFTPVNYPPYFFCSTL
ncbi:hypothetical protein TRVL_10303 [Trypanosoma vivax]|nr:hypothetical protein TRVL_10303 [Trypanosoma vivax]